MIAKGKILLVDHDRALRETLRKWLDGGGYRAGLAATAEEALTAIDSERWDLALVDIRLPGMDGLELLGRLQRSHPEVPVIMVTGSASVSTAVRALKNGAQDYLAKPLNLDELSRAIERALERSRSRREVERLGQKLQEISPKTDLVGQSAAMKRVVEQVETVSATDVPVLIVGERGTGKEIVARAIHAGGPRGPMPLAIVRCGTMSELMLESELFGYERETSPGAPYRKKGKFEIADGGTVFLDEISEVSLRTQNDLLGVMDSREIIRLGGTQRVKVDLRWIAAGNRDLKPYVQEGRFRSDFYYRLNVFTIELPPLRERREDIPLLADHFLRKHATAMNRPAPVPAKKSMDILLQYSWPGNVRELENAVERAILLSRNDEIQPGDFPFQMDAEAEKADLTLEEVERRHIEKVVEATGWNLSRSARMLGIDRTTLYNKLRRYGLR